MLPRSEDYGFDCARVPYKWCCLATGTSAELRGIAYVFSTARRCEPARGLIIDESGNFYGTTYFGGKADRRTVPLGMRNSIQTEFERRGRSGSTDSPVKKAICPNATLMRDATGNLFGTTASGGDTHCSPPYGCGTVFKLDSMSGKETLLHKFNGPPDGRYPHALSVKTRQVTYTERPRTVALDAAFAEPCLS